MEHEYSLQEDDFGKLSLYQRICGLFTKADKPKPENPHNAPFLGFQEPDENAEIIKTAIKLREEANELVQHGGDALHLIHEAIRIMENVGINQVARSMRMAVIEERQSSKP